MFGGVLLCRVRLASSLFSIFGVTIYVQGVDWGAQMSQQEQKIELKKPSVIQYKKLNLKIRGLSPLLMNRLNPESLKTKSRMKIQEYSTETDAANSAYIVDVDGKKELYIPANCIYSMIIKTAKQYRIKRTALSSLLAGTMSIEPEKVLLGRTEYEVDERAVVIQNQRILKGRARIPLPWAVEFQLVFDSNRLPKGIEATLVEIIEDAGTRMGLLDYRPQHQGWFGTFTIESAWIMGTAEDARALAQAPKAETIPLIETEPPIIEEPPEIPEPSSKSSKRKKMPKPQ
jgi:hypothetical protein